MFLLVPDVQITFIYFNHKENHSAADLLGSLLKQILGTEIISAIRDLYAKHVNRTTRPSLDEISDSDLLVSESRGKRLAKIPHECHVINDLDCGILFGNDVITPEKVVIDLSVDEYNGSLSVIIPVFSLL